MKKLLFILFLIPLLSFSQGTITLTDSDIKAFPTALGWGKNTTGGRGQTVYEVTNTNNSGAGSFREAVSTGNRVVVFKTSGTITLTSEIAIGGGNLTIAGQTAPGDGIAIYGDLVRTGRYDNQIYRHIRFRPGEAAASDGFRVVDQFATGAYSDYIFDHVSISWGDDENFSVETGTNGTGSVSNLTIQNSIISENFGSGNMILWGQDITNISVIRNLFANSHSRNIRASVTPNVTWEQINNFVYGYNAAVRPTVRHEVDLIGNVFEDGFGTQSASGTIKLEDCNSGNCPPSGDTNATGSKIYETDNSFNGGAIVIDATVTPYLQGGRINTSGYTPLAGSVVKDTVLSNAGARANLASGLDDLDLHIVADATNGSTGAFYTAVSQTTGLPTLASGTAYTDSDSDGLSDAYESAQGGSTTSISASARPATAVIGNGDTVDQSGVTSYASQGYTHLDIFLADLANDWDHFTSTPGGGPPAQGNESILKPHRVRFNSSTGAVYFGTIKIKG